MKKIICLILICALVFVTGCEKRDEGQDDAFTIVTSFYPMYVLAVNLTDGAAGVALHNMTPSIDGCLHDYSLSAKDMKLIETSDVFLAVGLSAEPFLGKLGNVTIIEAANGTSRVDGDNPHIWMNPVDYAAQIDYVAERLCELDAKNAAVYRENAGKYKGRVAAAYEEAGEVAAACSGKKAILVDDSLYYAALSAGVEIAAHIHEEAEGQHNAGELAEVVKAARDAGVDFILTREGYEESMCKTLAEETGAKVVYLDPVLSGDENDPDAQINAIKNNARALAAACE